MNELIFLQDLALVMVVSAVTMIICHRLHLPVVLGYILAGLFIGPHTPPYSFVTDTHSIHTLAALGVVFLLFSIGLEFSIKKLFKVGAVAFIAATFEILLMVWVGYSLGQWMGFKQMDSLFLGAILSISSTTIIAKILIENKKINEKFAQMILGILIVEDLWAIVIIAILSGIATTGVLTTGAISLSMVKVFVFIVGVLFLGFLFVPRILNYIDRLENQEMISIVVLGLCFGISLLAAKAGFSIALGAFLIGAVMAETKQGHRIIANMGSIRDMFTAIFFVSIGMMIEPAILFKYGLLILIITVVTIIGKVFSCSLAAFLMGHDSQTSLRVGLGLAQIGEFSFIIAQLGLDTQVTSSFLYPIAVSVSALTTITTPFLMNHSSFIVQQIKRLTPPSIVTFAHFYPSWLARVYKKEFFNNVIRLIIAITSSVVFAFAISFAVPTIPWIVILAGVVIFWGSFFWKSTRRIHEHIEKTILGIMDNERPLDEQQVQTTHDKLVELILTNYPLSFKTQDVLLPYTECAINRTIKELDVRSKTGVSIIAIYRDEKAILNPSAGERLLPGDILVIIGSEEQIKQGMQYFQNKMKER